LGKDLSDGTLNFLIKSLECNLKKKNLENWEKKAPSKIMEKKQHWCPNGIEGGGTCKGTCRGKVQEKKTPGLRRTPSQLIVLRRGG